MPKKTSYTILLLLLFLLNGCDPGNTDKQIQFIGAKSILVSQAKLLRLSEEMLREVEHVGGFAGFAIAPTKFLKLSVVFMTYGHMELFERFSTDPSPVLRAMGLVCLARTDQEYYGQNFHKHVSDYERISVFIAECMPRAYTVEKLASELAENPDLLGHKSNVGNFQQYIADVRAGKVVLGDETGE